MKRLILIPLAIIFFSAPAQDLTISLKNGVVKEVLAGANTPTQILTNSGNFDFSEIDSVIFHGYKPQYDGLRDRLTGHGIVVTIGEVRKSLQAVQSPLIATSADQPDGPIEINYDKFINQRNGGKVLQLLGLCGLAATSYLTIHYQNENQKRIMDGKDAKEVPTFLPWASLGAMGLGIVIDIDAGKHLRRR